VRACRYDPDLNPTYQEFAAHYGVGVVPARPYRPRDKAKAEVGVQIVERWIIAPQQPGNQASLSVGNGRAGKASSGENQQAAVRKAGTVTFP
jgi:transposase